MAVLGHSLDRTFETAKVQKDLNPQTQSGRVPLQQIKPRASFDTLVRARVQMRSKNKNTLMLKQKKRASNTDLERQHLSLSPPNPRVSLTPRNIP